MKKVNVGIIGFGEMGKRHALEFHESTIGAMIFPAVMEPDDLRYQQGCEWYGRAPRRYTSVKDMLKNETLDGLIISSPNCFHLENMRDCMAAKLPLLLEKPLESSLEKISEIVRLCQQYQAPVVVDHVMRYAPIIQKAKKLIESGRIGKVCGFSFAQNMSGGGLFNTYRRTIAEGGGQLVEKATHDLDAAFYLCNAAPRRVAAICRQQLYGGDKPNDLSCTKCDELECSHRTRLGETINIGNVKDISAAQNLCRYAKCVDVADNEKCLIDCTNGVFGTYSQCFFAENYISRRYEIIGTDAVMLIELTMTDKANDHEGRIVVCPRGKIEKQEVFKFQYNGKIHYYGGPFVGRHLYKLVNGEVEPFTSVQDAFAAEMVGVAAMRSSDTGEFVKIEDIVEDDLKETFAGAYGTSKSLDGLKL